MTALIDIDQLRTFIAIAETGSFTKAAEVVHKTQSAVSMQMKRLEERLNKPIFARDGRASKLTEDGERLLDYARRIVKLNLEALAAFSGPELSGRVRLGVPDDYADRYLPEIMARFSRAYPGVELTVLCEPSVDLLRAYRCERSRSCDHHRRPRPSGPRSTFRQERLLWVTSVRHATHTENPLPLALGQQSCAWRRIALECLEELGRPHRVIYTSSNAGAYVGRGAVGACRLGGAGIDVASGHAGADAGRRVSGIAVLPHRPGSQSARKLGAGRRARRAHHLVARQPVGSSAGGGVGAAIRLSPDAAPARCRSAPRRARARPRASTGNFRPRSRPQAQPPVRAP